MASHRLHAIHHDGITSGLSMGTLEASRVSQADVLIACACGATRRTNDSVNSAVSTEVNALRQQIATAELERTREREQLTDRIESLQQMLADEKSERRQLTALLSDHREKGAASQRRGFWARLRG